MDDEAVSAVTSFLLGQSDAGCADVLRYFRYGVSLVPPECPRCHTRRFCRIRSRPRVDQCRGCKKQLSVTAGTALHGLKRPLADAFVAAFLLTLRRSCSTNALAGLLGCAWEDASHLAHRVRAALEHDLPEFSEALQLQWATIPVRCDANERPEDPWTARNIRPFVRAVAVLDDQHHCIVDVTLRDCEVPAKHLVETYLPRVQDIPWSEDRPCPHLSRMRAVLVVTHQLVSRRWLRLYLRALAWRAPDRPAILGQVLGALVRAPPRTWEELRPPRIPLRP